jgi:hypothetical protein
MAALIHKQLTTTFKIRRFWDLSEKKKNAVVLTEGVRESTLSVGKSRASNPTHNHPDSHPKRTRTKPNHTKSENQKEKTNQLSSLNHLLLFFEQTQKK